MMALSFWQPWGSLVVCNVKPLETRAYLPPGTEALIGQRVAIHAALTTEGFKLLQLPGNGTAYAAIRAVLPPFEALPRGKMLGTALLWSAHLMGQRDDSGWIRVKRSIGPAVQALRPDYFGDYTANRWCLHFRQPVQFPEPVPARGMQGWWEWQGPKPALEHTAAAVANLFPKPEEWI
jgi:hypothetical protein